MKIKLEENYYNLSDEEIDVVINTLYDIKRERRMDEMQVLKKELMTVLDKIYDKGYRAYYEDVDIYSDGIEIRE